MHVYNTGLFLELTFVNSVYFKQCHVVEILCDVSIIETLPTDIPSTVEVTYNTAYSNDHRIYIYYF